MIYAVFFAFCVVVIASAVIMLDWLTLKEERKNSQKIDDLPVLVTCWSGIVSYTLQQT